MLYAIAFILSAAICGLIIYLNNNNILRLVREEDLAAVQASHLRATPRLGGVGIVAALLVSLLVSSDATAAHYLVILAASGLLGGVSLLEDIGKPMSPRVRLIAAAVSALMGILFSGYAIARTDEIITTAILGAAWPISVLLTVFIVSGLSNAFNLIDGMNGLCSSATIISAGALGIIAQNAGLDGHADLLLMLCMAVFGFMIFNFPRGHLFLAGC